MALLSGLSSLGAGTREGFRQPRQDWNSFQVGHSGSGSDYRMDGEGRKESWGDKVGALSLVRVRAVRAWTLVVLESQEDDAGTQNRHGVLFLFSSQPPASQERAWHGRAPRRMFKTEDATDPPGSWG